MSSIFAIGIYKKFEQSFQESIPKGLFERPCRKTYICRTDIMEYVRDSRLGSKNLAGRYG